MGDEHDLVRGTSPNEESRGEERSKKVLSSGCENVKSFSSKKNACLKLLSVCNKITSKA